MVTQTQCLREFSRDAFYGASGSTIALTAGYGGLKGSHTIMELWGIPLQEDPTHFTYYKSFSNVQNPLLRGALKATAVLYLTVLVPLIESWFFHHALYRWQEETDGPKERLAIRVFRVVTNAAIFGAFHFSLFAGWANLPVLVVSTTAGVVFATLREITGNVRATTLAHILNNTVVLLTL